MHTTPPTRPFITSHTNHRWPQSLCTSRLWLDSMKGQLTHTAELRNQKKSDISQFYPIDRNLPHRCTQLHQQDLPLPRTPTTGDPNAEQIKFMHDDLTHKPHHCSSICWTNNSLLPLKDTCPAREQITFYTCTWQIAPHISVRNGLASNILYDQ